MLLLALMDQRACKELEEQGPLQQNKMNIEEEDRGLAEERNGGGIQKGGRGGVLWGSGL